MEAGKNKVLLKIKKNPIIFYTLQTFENSKNISKIVLVAAEKDKKTFLKIVEKNKFKKVIKVISGGKERQNSAWNGIKFLDENIENKKDLILLFHNGANPFVSEKEIKESVRKARKYGASAVAQKTKDTIRKVDEKGFSLGVIDRSNLWNMQTPQTIKFNLAKKAFKKAEEDNFLGTDDVSLIERLGKKVKIIEASDDNFKITTPKDLVLAKIILSKK
jgi:2-C-methyl-D-erythritol 4-phosphate cytidylyltransferase